MSGDGTGRNDRPDEQAGWHALLATVPRRSPPPDLTLRLLNATRAAWPRAAERPLRTSQSEMAVTAGIVTGAALLTLMPVAVVAAWFLLDVGTVVASLTRFFVLTVDWLSAGLSVWEVLARAARVVGATIASPTGTVVMVIGFLTALLATAGLSRLLPVERGEL